MSLQNVMPPMTDAPRIVRIGVWLAAGTGVADLYPCRCASASDWEHRNGRCPCWGRTDVGAMAAGCCGWGWPMLWPIVTGAVHAEHLTRQYAGS